MLHIHHFELERLAFRSLGLEDAPQLFEIYSDKEAMKYKNSRPMESISDATLFIQNQELENEDHYTFRKEVELKEEKELIGSVMYQYLKNETAVCEIGYSIGSQYWGRGYGKEIVKAMFDSIRQQGKVQVVEA